MTVHAFKVLVLSSYIYDTADANPYAKMGRRNRWFRGFVKALVKAGSGLREIDVQFQRTPTDDGELANLTATLRPSGTDLVICPGTDSAMRVARYLKDVAMIYFGAHPENNGAELLLQPNVTGVRLNLPLIWSLENFNLLKAMVPRLKRIYFPLNVRSAFGFDNVRQCYRSHWASSEDFWIPGRSSWVGYRSLHFMAQANGIEYFEGPYRSAAELASGLGASTCEDSIYVGFNDSVLDDEATSELLRFVERTRSLLCWVNNPGIIEHIGLADFSSDFESVGRAVGEVALRILKGGENPRDIPLRADPGQRLLLNLKTAATHGLVIGHEIRSRFDELVPAVTVTARSPESLAAS
jgi:ABC-type uncharacterized transport system substrate-binding protein